MKIALVLASPPGYSETFFNSLIKGLIKEGHDVTLYTGYTNKSYNKCKHVTHPVVYKSYIVQVFFMIYRGITLLPNFKTVKTFYNLEKKEGTPVKRIIEKIYINASLLKYKGDWIHFGFATTALQREFVPAATGTQMAVSLRGYDMNVYPLKYPHCYDVLWKQVNKVHSISKYLLNKAHNLGLDKTKPFQVIYPSVNLENLPQLNDQSVRNKFKIITIARFSWIKGIELLTDVVLILKNKRVDFEWILIGSGTTTDKERFLFDINQKHLTQHLINLGECSHEKTLEILGDCDLYVQTSLNEGFCNAVLEAQALGIPPVAFNVGGLSENISDKKTGWLIEPYNVHAMADQIIDALALSETEKVIISKRAIKRVQDNFNLESQMQTFHEFYKC